MDRWYILNILLTVVYLWHAILAPQRLHVIAMERNGGCIVGRQWGQNYLAAPNLIDPLINKLIMAKLLAYLSRAYREYCQLNYKHLKLRFYYCGSHKKLLIILVLRIILFLYLFPPNFMGFNYRELGLFYYILF